MSVEDVDFFERAKVEDIVMNIEIPIHRLRILFVKLNTASTPLPALHLGLLLFFSMNFKFIRLPKAFFHSFYALASSYPRRERYLKVIDTILPAIKNRILGRKGSARLFASPVSEFYCVNF